MAFWKKFFVATAGYKTTTNLNEVIRNEVFFSFIYTDEERNLYPEFPKKRLILDFQEVPCEGNPPLVFKLGVTDEEAATVLRYTAETTLAFAYHAQYDPIAEESRGFVWLAADQGLKKYRGPQEQDRFWQEPASLYNILVHELGHVFGVQHIPKTLMDESFPVNAIAKGMKIRASGFEMMLNNITALTDKICGKAMAEEAVGEIWKLQQMAGRKICVQMRHDLLAVGEHDTPVLLQIFQDDGKVAIEQYLSTDGVYEGADYSIAGKFLVKNSSGQLDFFKANLTYFFSNEIYRGQFQALEQHYPLELEIIHPGAIVIRIFSGSRWLSLAFVPDGHEEEFSQLLGLYNLEQ